MFQLPIDCLNEIFEHLENDKVTLYSCLLVNRFWCKTSVRILWRIIRNYNTLKSPVFQMNQKKFCIIIEFQS